MKEIEKILKDRKNSLKSFLKWKKYSKMDRRFNVQNEDLIKDLESRIYEIDWLLHRVSKLTPSS